MFPFTFLVDNAIKPPKTSARSNLGLTWEQYDTSLHFTHGILPGPGQRLAQGNDSRGGDVSGRRVSSISSPRVSQSDAESKPNGSFDLIREANTRPAGEESWLELAVIGSGGDDTTLYKPELTFIDITETQLR